MEFPRPLALDSIYHKVSPTRQRSSLCCWNFAPPSEVGCLTIVRLIGWAMQSDVCVCVVRAVVLRQFESKQSALKKLFVAHG